MKGEVFSIGAESGGMQRNYKSKMYDWLIVIQWLSGTRRFGAKAIILVANIPIGVSLLKD